MAPGGYPSDNDQGNGHPHGEEKELWGDPVNPRLHRQGAVSLPPS